MIWVAWRQQRTETLIAVVVLALLAALLVPTGIDMASRYDRAGLSVCAASNTHSCQQAIQAFTARFDSVMSLLPWLNLLPGVIGIALAAPFLLELENGTYRLAWTQGITRRRWLAFKLGMPVLAGVLAALAMTVLVTWWRTPLDHLTVAWRTSSTSRAPSASGTCSSRSGSRSPSAPSGGGQCLP